MQKATMELWRPGGEYWRVIIDVSNEDPAVIVAQLSHFQAEAIIEIGSAVKTVCLYCGKKFETEDQRNGHLAVCDKRRAHKEARR
jgi:hypothetical protein